MSNTHIPERTCIICKAKNEKSKLFRLAKVKEAFAHLNEVAIYPILEEA